MLLKEALSCVTIATIVISCCSQPLMYMDNDMNNKTTVWSINVSNCMAERVFTINASNLYLRGYYSLGDANSIAWIGNGDAYNSYDSLITLLPTSNANHFEFLSNTGQKIRYLSMGYSVNSYCKDTALVLTALQYNFDTNLINYGCLSVATGEFRGKPITENREYNLFVDYQFGGGIYDNIRDILWATFYNSTSWINIQINGDGTDFHFNRNGTNSMQSGIECHYSNGIIGYPCIGYDHVYDYWDQKQTFVNVDSGITNKLYTMSINPMFADSVLLMDNEWNIYNLNTTNLSYNLVGKIISNDNAFPIKYDKYGKLWSLAG